MKHVWPSNKKILITLLNRSSYFVEFKLIKKNYFSNEIIGKKRIIKTFTQCSIFNIVNFKYLLWINEYFSLVFIAINKLYNN